MNNYFNYFLGSNNTIGKIQELKNIINNSSDMVNDLQQFSIDDMNSGIFDLCTKIKEYEEMSLSKFGKDLSIISGDIISALNNDPVYGSEICKYGFFDLPVELVEAFDNIEYFSWGGYYSNEHDWMHFEVRNSSKRKYGSDVISAQEKLLESALYDLINKLNSISFIDATWNNDDKEYIIVKEK